MNMSGFFVNVLSASDLTKYRFRTEQELPEKGQREYQPSNSWLETEQLKTALEERLQLVAEERVSRLGTLAKANWDDQIKEALVTRVVGRHWQLFGHERRTRIWLYPEEALFLVECGCLELMHNGVAMSIQQAYCTLLSPNTNRTLNEYRTYSHLLRHGYRVLRHTPHTKSVSSDSRVDQKSVQIRGVVEVVDISDSKPGSSTSSHSKAGTSINPGVHAKKEPSTTVNTTFFDLRTKTPCAEVLKENFSHKPVSKVPTDEADVTLVYEQKGPVMQSCLKPKGSLVLFPDSQFEPQSSSRTGNVTPIDIDDNELEISYVNKNVSVTLSPQKKEKHDFGPSTLETVSHEDTTAEVLLTNTIKESPSNKIDDELEEQSVTVEPCPSEEGSLQGETPVLMQESVNGSKDADDLHTTDLSSDNVLADERNTQDNKANKEMPNDVLPVVSTESEPLVGAENQKHLSSVSEVSPRECVTEESSIDCSSTVTIQAENSEASDEVLKTNLNVQEISTSECLLVTNRKISTDTNVAVVMENDILDNISSSDLIVVERNGHVDTSLLKSEAGDVIDVQENDCRSQMKTVASPTSSDVEIDTNSKEIKSEWSQIAPKKENADIEIICVSSQPNFPKNVKEIVTGGNLNQSTEDNNYFNNKRESIGNSGWKQSASVVCVKPDVEIVFLEEESSNCSTAGVHGNAHQNKAWKRSHEDLDVKECPSAKKQLVSSDWLPCSSETDDTKPSSSQDFNVINLDDDEARLTLAEKRAVLDAIPSVENKFTIHVQTPKQELLPPNVKPKQKDYYVQLWRLKASGFGGGPARNASNPTNNFPVSQQIRQNHIRSDDTQRINPWLPVPLFQQHQPPLPLLGFGNGLLPHPMFAQAVMMAQSLAMAQSFAMNFNYHQGQQRFYRGRYLHRPYFRRGFKRRYNGNNRNEPYNRYQGQSNNSRHFSRNSHNEESSDSQSRSQSTSRPQGPKISEDKKLQVVIDIDDDSNEKLGRTGDSDDEVIECYEVTPSLRGSSGKRRERTRGRPGNRYFAPSRKFRQSTEKMWHDERNDVEEISMVGTVGRLPSHLVKHERKSLEVTLSSDEEVMDDSMLEQGRGLLDIVDEDNMELVPCLQPEYCKNVDTILSRLQIFQQGKKPRNMVNALGRKQLRITFDLYLPSMSFRKATPGIPDYRIIVFSQEHSISNYEQSMPTLGDISWALKDFDDCVPLLLARVDSDTIQFTLFARIDLPVAPGIACDVL